jgi:hypothetical protein
VEQSSFIWKVWYVVSARREKEEPIRTCVKIDRSKEEEEEKKKIVPEVAKGASALSLCVCAHLSMYATLQPNIADRFCTRTFAESNEYRRPLSKCSNATAVCAHHELRGGSFFLLQRSDVHSLFMMKDRARGGVGVRVVRAGGETFSPTEAFFQCPRKTCPLWRLVHTNAQFTWSWKHLQSQIGDWARYW